MVYLRSIPANPETQPGRSFFEQLRAVVEDFADFVNQNEGIQVTAIHPHEVDVLEARFAALSIGKQFKKLQHFTAYFEYCQDLKSQGIPLSDKKRALKAFMKKFGICFPKEDEIFEVLDDHTIVEMYDLDFIQCYRSIDFLNATSHSLMALETSEWWELFERSSVINDTLMGLVRNIYNGSIREAVYIPVESHTVKELGSHKPLSSQSDVILFSPIYDEQGLFQGGLHFFKVKSVYSLDFKVWN